MGKILAVLDTNVLISAAFRIPDSTPGQILQTLRSQAFILVTSPQIIEEIEEVINRERIIKRTRMSSYERQKFINDLIDISRVVSGADTVQIVKDDPDDDKFIIAAIEGNADYIISGDHHLLDLEKYNGITVLSPAKFLAILKKKT